MTDPEVHSDPDVATAQGGGLRMPRSRGVVSGVVLLLAGAWGALAPFVGPYFHFAYTPKPTETWHWTAARGWYEVLPGGLALVGGLLLILSANRILTSFGAWIAALAGGWFVVGQQVSFLLTLGSPGGPAATGDRRYVAEYLAFFTGLGALIILFAAIAIGRLSVRSVRDVRAATRRDQDAALAEQEAAEREARARDDDERATTDRAVTDRNAQTWAAGDDRDGYGTPGTAAEPGTTDGSSSATTTELPVAGAGAAAGAGALYAGERLHDDDDDRQDHDRDADGSTGATEHAPYRRADAGRDADPDADTTAMPIAPEPEPELEPEPAAAEPEPAPAAAEPEQAHPEQAHPEQAHPEQAHPEPARPEPVAAEPATPAAADAEPPLVLEPPEGHADALRLEPPESGAGGESPAAEPTGFTQVTHEAEPASTPGTTPWNPEAQSPTTTGEIPALGSNPPPPAAEAPRRGIQQPRRYYGPNDPARPADPSAEAAPRDPVRTDEADDLDDMDLDERSR